jgi:hypothetical protein
VDSDQWTERPWQTELPSVAGFFHRNLCLAGFKDGTPFNLITVH